MATVTWTGASGGNYNTASNWSTGVVPTGTDDVVIGASVVDISASNSVDSVTLAGPGTLDVLGGAYTIKDVSHSSSITGTIDVQGGATLIAGGTANTFNTSGFLYAAPGGTIELLGAVANSGTIFVDQNGGDQTRLLAGPTPVTLSGGGTVVLTNNGNIGIAGAASGDVLLNVNNVIQGGGQVGAGSLILTNESAGVIDADSGQMTLNAKAVTNVGLIEATAGTMLITTGIADSGGTIEANGNQVFLQGASIVGGALNSTSGTNIDVTTTATLFGVSNSGSLYVAPGATLSLQNSIQNLGTIELDQNGGDQTRLLIASSSVSLTGGGKITLINNGNIGITGAAATDVLVNVGDTIQGGGQIGVGKLTVTNDARGILDANSGTMTVNATTVTNLGLMEANGGSLVITTGVANAGGTIAAEGSQVFLNSGASIQGGLLTSTAGTNIDDNGSATLDGSVNAVTNDGSVYLAPGAALSLLGTIDNAGTILLDQNGGDATRLLVASPTLTLTGAGTVVLTNNGNIGIADGGTGDTLDNVNNLIQGGGQLGVGSLTVINAAKGTIAADAGATMTVNASTVTNLGLLEAAGGNLVITTAVDNVGGTIKATGNTVFLQGASIAGGLLTTTSGGTIEDNGTATLNGVTNSASSFVYVAPGDTLSLLGTIDNAGTIYLDQNGGDPTRALVGSPTLTLTGGGTITLASNPNIGIADGGTGDTLVNVNNLIQGGGHLGEGSLSVTNDATGVIAADNGATMTVDPIGITNLGLMEAAGGTLVIATVVANAGGTIDADGNQVLLQGASIEGGVLTSTATTNLDDNGTATLDGSSDGVLTNDGSVYVAPGADLSLLGTIDNVGTILLDQNGGDATRLTIASSTVALTGGGTVILTNNGNIGITAVAGADVLNNINNLIQGGGQLGAGTLTVTNEAAGVIAADAGATMTVNATSVTNLGLMEAAAGTMVITTTVANTGGTIEANGSQVYINSNASIQGGLLTSLGNTNIDDNGVATLDGSVSAVTNTGSIYLAPSATLSLLGTIDNAGTIFLDQNGGDTTRLLIASPTLTLTGGGTIALASNGNIGITGGATSDVLVNVNNLIEGGGQLGVGSLAVTNEAAGVIAANDGSMTVNANTVTNLGLMEAAGSDMFVTTAVANAGGTIEANTTQLFLQGASIQGGLLTSVGSTDIEVNTSAVLNGVTNTGSIYVAPGATLSLLNTIDNTGTIFLDQNGGDQTRLLAASPTLTLTGGGTITLANNGNIGIAGVTGAATSDVLVNVNNLIQGGGQLGIGSLILTNDSAGIIDADSGQMTLNAKVAVNSGLLEATAGTMLITTGVVNAGTIDANGSQIFLQGATIIGGLLTSTSGTNIDVTTAAALNNLVNKGSLYAAPGATLSLLNTIDNAGTIFVDQNGGDPTRLLIGSPTLTLTGGGTITLANNGNIGFASGDGAFDTLDDVANTIQGGANIGFGAMAITIGATGVIDANNGTMNFNPGSQTISVSGLLEATGGGFLNFQSGTLGVKSSGTLAAIGGNATLASSVSNTNLVGGTLTLGTWSANAATLTITGGTIGIDDATIDLTGPGAEILAGSGTTFTAVEQTLSTIEGQLNILGGRNYSTGNTLTVATGGLISLGGGTLSDGALTIAAGGSLKGFGTIKPVTNNGLIVASGGDLQLTGAIAGSGSAEVLGGATLEIGVADAQTVVFAAPGADLKLDAPSSFAGSLSGWTLGDSIEFTGRTVESAAIVGTTLDVTTNSGSFAYNLGTTYSSEIVLSISNTGGNGFVTPYHLAVASTPTPDPVVLYGHVSTAGITQVLTIGNTAPSPYSENLDASIVQASGSVTASGSITGVPPGGSNDTGLTVTLDAANTGTVSGQVTIALTSDGTGIGNLGTVTLTKEVVPVSGTIYAYADPILTPGTTFDLGATRVGGSLASATLTIANGTSANAFQENLLFDAALPSGFTLSADSGTIDSGGSASLGLTLSTASSGDYNGSQAVLGLTSQALVSELSNTVLPSSTLTLNGEVFQAAIAQVPTTTINFGVVHIDQAITATLGVTNSASGALVDNLIGGVGSLTTAPGVSDSGSLNLGAGASGTLNFTLKSATAEVLTGSAALALQSHDTVLANAAVSTPSITLTGTVDNYATAAMEEVSGGGTLVQSGNVYTLILPEVKGSGGGSAAVNLGVANAATGPADLLGGSFIAAAKTGFSLSGFANYAGLAAGQADTAPMVNLATTADGLFIQTVATTPTGSNSSGFTENLGAEFVAVDAAVADAVIGATPTTIVASGSITLATTGGALQSGDSITGGTGSNELILLGGGSFNLAAPGTLSAIGTVIAQEGQPANGSLPNEEQTVTLRAGLNLTLSVQGDPLAYGGNPSPAGIIIEGAANNDIVNFGSGADQMTLGGPGEEVFGGGSTLGHVFTVAADAGALLEGKTSTDTVLVEVTNGGTATLNGADANLVVQLDAATNLSLGTASFISATAETAGSTITAGATGQTLGGVAGGDTLVGFSGFGDTFLGASAGLNNDVIQNFGGSEGIDLTDMTNSSSLSLNYTPGTGQGLLSVSDGVHSASITLIGTFVASNFVHSGDGHTGTLITYS